jgi:hypothetical protein
MGLNFQRVSDEVPQIPQSGLSHLGASHGHDRHKKPIAGANPVATSPVNKEPPVSQLSSAPNGPWVGAIQRLVGLQ